MKTLTANTGTETYIFINANKYFANREFYAKKYGTKDYTLGASTDTKLKFTK